MTQSFCSALFSDLGSGSYSVYLQLILFPLFTCHLLSVISRFVDSSSRDAFGVSSVAIIMTRRYHLFLPEKWALGFILSLSFFSSLGIFISFGQWECNFRGSKLQKLAYLSFYFPGNFNFIHLLIERKKPTIFFFIIL